MGLTNLSGGLKRLSTGLDGLPVVVRPSAPAMLSLFAWWKADAGIGVADGEPVPSWADQSGYGRTLLQADEELQPTFAATFQNSLPGVHFDATSLATAAVGMTDTGCSVFAVVRMDSAGTDPPFVAYGQADAGSWGLGAAGTSGHAAFLNLATMTGSGAAGASGPDLSGGSTTALVEGHLTAADLWTLRVAGTAYDPVTVAFTMAASKSIGVGAYGDGSGAYAGYLGEVMVFNPVLSDANAASVRSYLTTRWGL